MDTRWDKTDLWGMEGERHDLYSSDNRTLASLICMPGGGLSHILKGKWGYWVNKEPRQVDWLPIPFDGTIEEMRSWVEVTWRMS